MDARESLWRGEGAHRTRGPAVENSSSWSAMNARSCGAPPSKSLNQACVDQQPVEASRLRAAGAEIEQSAAALEDLLLLREAPIERHSRPFQHHQRKIRRVERIERGREIDGAEIHPFGGVIGGEITGVTLQDAACHLGLVERGVDEPLRKQRLVVAEAHEQELLVGKFAPKPLLELSVVARAHLLAAKIFVDLERISRIDPFGQEIGTVVVIPGKVVGGEVDEDKDRTAIAVLSNHPSGLVVKEAVGVGRAGVQLLGIEEMFDAGGCLKAAGADEGPEPGIEAVGAVAASA